MSDGYADQEKAEKRATDPRDLMMRNDTVARKRVELEVAVRRSATIFGAARLLLSLAGPVAGALPYGATAAELAKFAVELAERETS